jgi:hypothetical protein
VTCRYTNATALCTNGACALGGCNSGYANCNSSSFDGCEVNTLTSYLNCGRCGNVCGGASCSNGACRCGDPMYPQLCPSTPSTNEITCWGGTTAVNCASIMTCGGQRRACSVGRTSRCAARSGFTCCATSDFFCDHPDAPCWSGPVNCQTIQNCGSTGWRACNAGQSGSPCSNTCR